MTLSIPSPDTLLGGQLELLTLLKGFSAERLHKYFGQDTLLKNEA